MVEPTHMQRQLDAFLVDNRELESLGARLDRFNLFSVLKIQKAEIRHSNVLAWLLTSGETHGLGDKFLCRFLSRLLMENEVDVALTPAQVELMDLNDVVVDREWRNIDLYVRSYRGNWALHIENKIGANEKPGALLRYLEQVRDDMPDAQIVSVFLTVDGEEPSEKAQDAGYVALSHVDVLELAERIIAQNANSIPADASAFLIQYLDTLRRITMQDTKLVDLCKTIYRKHREAIDLIVEYGTSSVVEDAVLEEIETLVDCEFTIRHGKGVWFLPKELCGPSSETVNLSSWAFLPRSVPVMWWFNYWKKGEKLGLVLEVGPVADGNTRRKLLSAIRQNGFVVKESSFKEGAKFTRILSKYQKLKSREDGEASHNYDDVRGVARSLWKDLGPQGAKVAEILKNFDWRATDQPLG